MAAGDDHGVARGSSVANAHGDTPAQADTYTLEVLHMIKEAQQQHGLRHGDWQRYRQYCSRRLRRIRKSLHFPQGTRHKVVPKKITEANLTDIRYLYLPLVDAERSWSYSQQLKAEANTEPRKRFHMINKLKKAVKHAETLATLCESVKCDARTKLEAQAYLASMKGSLHFELENWKTAIDLLGSAKTIYAKLAGAFVDDIKEVYLQRVEELAPSIRYCAYNIGDESAIDDLRQMRLKTGTKDALASRLDELIEKTREKQSTSLSEVTWRGRTVPVKNEKVRTFLLSVMESERQLGEAGNTDSKLSICESLIKELIDAQQALRDELKDDQVFRAIMRGQKVEDRVPNHVYLHTYLAYLRQTKTIERNLLMIESLKLCLPGKRSDSSRKVTKPQDLARLYDIIIQSLSEIPSLPGVEDDAMLTQDINAQILGYKAFRCFYTAHTYSGVKKWKEAITLYEQVLKYASGALKEYVEMKGNSSRKKVTALEELVREVEGLKYSVHASSILDTEDVNATPAMSNKTKLPLCDRLGEYMEDASLMTKKPNLVPFPPDFEPTPCKPLFFDLALSHVEFPSLDDRLEQKKVGGGLTGLVGWLWGGKK